MVLVVENKIYSDNNQKYDRNSNPGMLDICNKSLQSFTRLAIRATIMEPTGRKHSRIE